MEANYLKITNKSLHIQKKSDFLLCEIRQARFFFGFYKSCSFYRIPFLKMKKTDRGLGFHSNQAATTMTVS